jgi:hypothetical protein
VSQATVIALSISGGIKTLGAYAGLAAAVAIALLILLYFAHARELKRLSEQITREAQRPRPPLAPPNAPQLVRQPPPGARPPVAGANPPAGAAPPAPGAVLPAPPPALTPRPAGASPVAASVEGVRRVRLPGAASGQPTAVQPPPASTSPDATTISEVPEAESAALGAGQPLPPSPDAGPPPPQPPDAGPLPPPPPDPAPLLPPPPPDLAPLPAGLPPRLIAQSASGFEQGSVYEIGDGVMLGRGKAASIRLTDPLASGRHARVAPAGESVMIEDLGSTNGTFLNGALIGAPATLSAGDRIRLGESEFVFEQSPPPLPEPPPTAAEQPPTEASSRPAAVPLMATPVAEQSFELPEVATPPEPAAAAGVPLPHRDSPVIEPAPDQPQAAPRISRRNRGRPPEERQSDAAPRSKRRLRGGGELPSLQAARRRLLLLGVLVIAVIAAIVVALGSGGGGSNNPSNSSGQGGNAATAGNQASGTPARSRISVAVLNATNTSGLAGIIEQTLKHAGFAKGQIGNEGALEQTTTVAYAKGDGAAADQVAQQLGLTTASVAPLTKGDTDSLEAKAALGRSHPQVVVIVGVSHPQ